MSIRLIYWTHFTVFAGMGKIGNSKILLNIEVN